MVKCVVSGCPNRVVNAKRGVGNPPPKRFFNFPSDPARVKVWLAALRETDTDSAEQHVICEDHFLPEDIHKNTVKSDAIPIMPPCLDGTMGPWGAESSEEEDQWATGGGDEEEEEEEEDEGPGNPAPPAPPPVSPPQLGTRIQTLNLPEPSRAPAAKSSGVSVGQRKEAPQPRRVFSRQDLSLAVLTQRFLELMHEAPDQGLDIRQVIGVLQTRRRRIYDITNVLEGISVIERKSANRFKWISQWDIPSFLSKQQHTLQKELESMKLVEDTLDTLIKSCAQQLFQMTDDRDNARLAYVTHDDVSRLPAFQEQTVIAVKAPEETKLEVPAPKENSIQVHLKAGKGPISVLACDVVDVSSGKSGGFLALEETRIKTASLQTGTGGGGGGGGGGSTSCSSPAAMAT